MFSDPRRRLALVFLLTILLPTGCSKDAPVAPSLDESASSVSDGVRLAEGLAPADPRGGPRANLRNIWPNEDGREWTYRIDQREWFFGEFRIFPTEADVPPIPTLDDVVALLGNHPIGSNPTEASGGYRMKFNGSKTTLSGATGQNLETSLFDLAGGSARPLANAGDAAQSAVSPGFIRALSRARPDLREKIEHRWPSAARLLTVTAGAANVDEPLFLFGYAFAKTREYIGSYGDLNLDLSWKYLDSNLQPGSEYSMQLIPDLADDVFLHVRVLREVTATTAVGSIPHAIEVLYLVDYGVAEATNANGDPIGYFGNYGYGVLTYAPRIGPVGSYERPLIQVGLPLDPGFGDWTISLLSVSPGRAPSAPAP